MDFPFSIFDLTADINSVTIFALLPINAIFLAITFYNMEHVSAMRYNVYPM